MREEELPRYLRILRSLALVGVGTLAATACVFNTGGSQCPQVGLQSVPDPTGCPATQPATGDSCTVGSHACAYCPTVNACQQYCTCGTSDAGADGAAGGTTWTCTPQCPIGGPQLPPDLPV